MEVESWDLIKFINIPLGIISIIGCLLILISFVFFNKIRSFVLEMVFYLALSCSMHTFAYIIYFPKNESDSEANTCQFQAFSMLLFGDAQFIWTSLISFSIFQSVIYLKDISTKNSKYKRFVYLLIGFGLPLVISVVGLLIDIYGISGFWCYIKADTEAKYKVFFVVNFALIWFCILANVVFYVIVIRFIKQNVLEDESHVSRKKYIYSLISYFLIQIICVMPATINRVYQLTQGKRIAFLDYTQSVFDCSQGLAYSVVYGLNPTVKESIKVGFQRFFRRRESSLTLNTRKETEESDPSLKSNIDFTRITLIDREDDTIVSD